MTEVVPAATSANWLDAPFHHWGFKHVEALLPVRTVDRGAGPVSRLPSGPEALSGFLPAAAGNRPRMRSVTS